MIVNSSDTSWQRGFVAAALSCLLLGFSSLAEAAVCDVDTDGDVDRQDISLILSARDTPADGSRDSRDPDGDGNITVFDARTCIRRCNLPDCVVVEPVPPPATGDSDQLKTPKPAPVQNEGKKPLNLSPQIRLNQGPIIREKHLSGVLNGK